MSSPDADRFPASLDRRLAHLERRVIAAERTARRWRWIAAGVASTGLVAGLMSAGAQDGVLDIVPRPG